jgi:hypothetical protein
MICDAFSSACLFLVYIRSDQIESKSAVKSVISWYWECSLSWVDKIEMNENDEKKYSLSWIDKIEKNENDEKRNDEKNVNYD